jgi:ferredoxin
MMAGECVYNHPWLFEFDDEGLPKVRVAIVADSDQIKGANQAREVCPSGAIQLLDN